MNNHAGNRWIWEWGTLPVVPRLPLMPRGLLPRQLHLTQRPSATAQGTTLSRALELLRPDGERIVTDHYAPVFLGETVNRMLAPLRRAGGLLHTVERTEFASISTSALCRHRFMDEHLLEAVPEVSQIVILGAGYDSRAYRFPRSIGARPVYEVDLAPLSQRKAKIVQAHPEVFGRSRITRVEIDFRTDSLPERLLQHGFERGAATFVVWEGVSMYLTRDAVLDTLHALAGVCGPGSTLVLDFWRRASGFGLYDQARRLGELAVGLIGEPITFTTDPDDASALLRATGFEVVDLTTASGMTTRFATGGRRCDDSLFVVAAQLG